MLTGYKTLIVGGLLAIAPAALQWAGAVDWSQYVSPTTATAISGAVMILMRMVTTTPPLQGK